MQPAGLVLLLASLATAMEGLRCACDKESTNSNSYMTAKFCNTVRGEGDSGSWISDKNMKYCYNKARWHCDLDGRSAQLWDEFRGAWYRHADLFDDKCEVIRC
ncbi:hypothetical protein ACHAQA_005810 [Verticillium albo-atrum]